MNKVRHSFHPDIIFDAREMNCPVSLLQIRRLLKDMGEGKILEIVGTNAGLKNDLLTIFSRSRKEILLENLVEGDLFKVVIKKMRRTP